MKKRKICVVTGSRSEYGLLYWLLKEIKRDSALQLQVVVTGMHLSSKFGSTYKVIQKDGFKIDAKVPILHSQNSDIGVTKSIGIGCEKFADIFKKLKPDFIVILGDRYEMLSVAIAAYISKIPLAHIHGGEITEGLIDEGIRHSITKMSSIHFTSTDIYRKRVIQLGESPKYTFNFGAPGLDHLYKNKLFNRDELSSELQFDLGKTCAICTYHPVTLEKNSAQKQIGQLLSALKSAPLQVIFTKANADPDGEVINKAIAQFCRKNPKRFKLFNSLGQHKYYSCLKHCQLMIGNSSSGLIEAASFGLPVVNIGDRQTNRVKGKNVIDVGCSKNEITRGIKKALDKRFTNALKGMKNPYDRYSDGKTSFRIKEQLKKLRINKSLIKKRFHNLTFNPN